MATANSALNPHNTTTSCCGTIIPFDSIQQPGCYVCNWSGHLLRVPEDGVAAGRSPLVNIIGTDPLFVTMLSETRTSPSPRPR